MPRVIGIERRSAPDEIADRARQATGGVERHINGGAALPHQMWRATFGAEKPHARICEGKAEWLSYSTTTDDCDTEQTAAYSISEDSCQQSEQEMHCSERHLCRCKSTHHASMLDTPVRARRADGPGFGDRS